MPTPRNPLMPLGAIVVDRTVIVPDAERPVAGIIDEDLTVRWVTWPEAPLPDRAIGEVRLLPAAGGTWVIYQAEDTEGPDYLVQRTAVFVTASGVTAACDLGQAGRWVLMPTGCGSVIHGTRRHGWNRPISKRTRG